MSEVRGRGRGEVRRYIVYSEVDAPQLSTTDDVGNVGASTRWRVMLWRVNAGSDTGRSDRRRLFGRAALRLVLLSDA